jgi:hypothetical protein
MWNKADVDSLEGSAMKEMISSRKKNLLEEDSKDKAKLRPLFLHYRLLVGSRTFTNTRKYGYMVPYADMLNASNDPNVDWKIKGDTFTLKAMKQIKKGEQCFDDYGTKTNYEALLFYGMVMEDNLKNDITYEMLEIPPAIRTNLNYDYFKNTVEFELCGSYSRGTSEIFSLLRFLACANANKNDCPKRLNGFDCKPISKSNELAVVKVLRGSLMNIYNKKIVRLKGASKKVESFAMTEINVLLHWIDALEIAIRLLSVKNLKAAKKLLAKLKNPIDYVTYVVRKLILDKRAYIKSK